MTPVRLRPRHSTLFQLLGSALDLLVQAGVLTAQRRAAAKCLAWSAVHGMALRIIEGLLQRISPSQVDALSERLLDMVARGL